MGLKIPQVWMRWALFNFFVAAVYGVLLRYAFVAEIPGLNYRHFLHSHSHVAMLGWVYQAFFALLVYGFLPPDTGAKKYYRRLYLFSQICVMSMAVTFPVFGYHPWSIAFSTAHVVFSYAFVFFLIKDLRRGPQTYADAFLYAALAFMLISTLALWSIGMLIGLQKKGSILYYAAVQFYLHFQFNGWFTFAALALLLRTFASQGFKLDAVMLRRLFWILLLSCVLTYALPLTWLYDNLIFLWINGAGVVLQAAAVFGLLVLLGKRFSIRGNTSMKLWFFAGCCYVLKVGLQLTTLLPEIATVAATIRNFVIGFFHLLLLGAVSIFIIGTGLQYRLLDVSGLSSRIGLGMLILGFVASELLLFLQGLLFWQSWGFMPYYYECLLSASLLLLIGIGLVLIFNLKYSGEEISSE